jgi:hypothetical protein
MVNEPANDPLTEGEKTTPVEQPAPAARVAPQVFWTRLKGADVERASEVAEPAPVLVIDTTCGVLACPGATIGKTSCAGLTLIPAGASAVPGSA